MRLQEIGCESMHCSDLTQDRDKWWAVVNVAMNNQVYIIIIIIIIIWIGVQFRSLPPGSTAASVAYCTIPRFLNVPTLAARSLSRPQPAVAP